MGWRFKLNGLTSDHVERTENVSSGAKMFLESYGKYLI